MLIASIWGGIKCLAMEPNVLILLGGMVAAIILGDILRLGIRSLLGNKSNSACNTTQDLCKEMHKNLMNIRELIGELKSTLQHKSKN